MATSVFIASITMPSLALAEDGYTPPPVKGSLNIQDDIVSHSGDIITKDGDVLINGLLKIGGANATCDDKTTGMIRAVDSTIQVCNGTDWQTAKGDTGEKGEQGIQGDEGDIGQRGRKGNTGDDGATGDDGDDGDDGDTGKDGKDGKMGQTGATGPQGIQGERGDDGDSFFSEVGGNAVYNGGLEVENIQSNGFVKIGQTDNSCDSAIQGAMRFKAEDKMMEFCNGSAWLVMAYTQASRDNPDDNIPTTYNSCKAILDAGESTGDGYYDISPEAGGNINVYCDMTTDGGGWTQLIRGVVPMINHPAWNNGNYDNENNENYISKAWFKLKKFTEFKTHEGKAGNISTCFSNKSMSEQVALGVSTCDTAKVSGIPWQDKLYFNPKRTHNSCADLSANVAYRFHTWDNGISGSWHAISSNGYKTNNTNFCSSECVKYSNSCRADTYNGLDRTYTTNRDFWVR